MSYLSLPTAVLSPKSGRGSFIYSAAAELLNSDVYVDGLLDADTLTLTDELGGVLVISDTVTDTLTLSDVLSGDYIVQSSETITPTDSLEIPDQTAAALVETLTAADSLSVPEFTTLITETLTANDVLSGALSITSTLSDTLTITDQLSAGLIPGAFVETLTAADVLGNTSQTAKLIDTVTATDVLSGVLSMSETVTEYLTPSDSLGVIALATVTETLAPTDVLSGNIGLGVTVTETITTSDTLTGLVALYGTVTESLTVSDTLTGSLALLGVFTETLTAGDTLITAQSQAVWAINAETGAVSEYRFTPTVQGVGAWRNQLYLATDTGLYALDAATDDDAAIEWAFRTGFSNMGTDALKRILDVNVLARGAGDVVLVLVADRHGQKEERRYQLVKLTADALRDQVIKAGKGIASVYWQVGCQGIGPAEIDQLRLRIEPLSRRR